MYFVGYANHEKTTIDVMNAERLLTVVQFANKRQIKYL